MQTVYRELIDRQVPFEERACLSKVRYSSRREARSLVRHGRRQDGTLEPYRCQFCGEWHLGHGRSGKARRIARRTAILAAA
jgi:hypothetical protein